MLYLWVWLGFIRCNPIPFAAFSPCHRYQSPTPAKNLAAFRLLFFSSMADATRGRGVSPSRNLAYHDAEAGSSSQPIIWHSKQAHDRDRHSHSGGRIPWAGFRELDANLFSHIQRCREADAKLIAMECAMVHGEEGATNRLTAVKDEHTLANMCQKSAEKFYLSVDE